MLVTKPKKTPFWNKYSDLIAIQLSFMTVGINFGMWQHSFQAGLFMWSVFNAAYCVLMYCHLKFLTRKYGC